MYNPTTQQYKHKELVIHGTPTAIQSIVLDEHDKLHIGGYFTGGYASYDTVTGQFSESRVLGQSEQIYAFKNKIYFGIYPGANILEYDASLPWEKNKNPKQVFSLYNYDQDRPFAMTSTEDCLVIGTVPNYGKLGGAIAFYNPETEKLESFINIVESQSIISLCYFDGIIYGGTSVYGGLGGKPKAEDGVFFLWDTKKHEKLLEIVPIKGEKVVSAITIGQNGLIWAMTTGHLFAFDSHTRTIVHMVQLFEPLDWENLTHFWRGVYIDYDLEQDVIYGNCIDKLFKYDVKLNQLDILATGNSLYARNKKGQFYFTKDSELYKMSE